MSFPILFSPCDCKSSPSVIYTKCHKCYQSIKWTLDYRDKILRCPYHSKLAMFNAARVPICNDCGCDSQSSDKNIIICKQKYYQGTPASPVKADE